MSTFAEMGGKIYAMQVKDAKGGNFTSPNMDSEEMQFDIKNINKNLGIELNEKEIKKNLEKQDMTEWYRV